LKLRCPPGLIEEHADGDGEELGWWRERRQMGEKGKENERNYPLRKMVFNSKCYGGRWKR
jgi:hypothetical protein